MSQGKKKSATKAARHRVNPPAKERFEILIDEMRSEFKAVAESVVTLDQKISGLREDMNQRFDDVDRRFSDTHKAMASTGRDLSDKIAAVDAKQSARSDIREAKIDAVDANLSAKIDAVDGNFTAKIDAVARDLKEHRADTEAHALAH
jgi:phage-related protein